MKKLSLKDFLAILIFLLVVLTAVLVVRPLYNAVTMQVNETISKIIDNVEKKTGLSVSYESLSPSVFTGLYIKNVSLTDVSDGNTLTKIKRTVVRYSLWDLIKGKGVFCIKDISIDGFIFEFDDEHDEQIVSKIRNLVSGRKVYESDVRKGDIGKNSGLEIDKMAANLPFNIYVKNLQFKFRKKQIESNLHLRRITVAFLNNSRQLMVKTLGDFSVSGIKGNKISLGFSADGIIPENLEGSAVTFRLSDITNGAYALNHLNLLLDYKNRSFDIRTIQNGYPVFLQGNYNIDSKDAVLALRSKNFKPVQSISLKKSDADLRKLKNLLVTMNAEVKYNGETRDFSYGTDGNIRLPDFKPGNVFENDFSVTGNKDKVVVNKFNISGNRIDMDFYGSYAFDGMKLSGALNLNHLELNNGGVVSTEVYFDPKKKGFMAFAPQLMLDERALTALQLSVTPVNDSVDFEFEVSDYSHQEADSAGLIKVNGSYIGGTKYIQANVSSSALYLDSLARTAAFFGKNKSDSTFSFLKNYIFNADFFVSTDFKNVSYNIPYAFIANTAKENQLMYISLDGNKESLNLSRFDFASKGNLVHLAGLFEKSPDGDDAFFMLDMTSGSVPYHFTGNIMPGVFSMSGDYGVSFDIQKLKNKIEGSFEMEGFPVSISNGLFTFSADTKFTYSKADGLDIKINRVEGIDAVNKFGFNPEIKLAGSVSKYGMFLEQIAYSDKFSSLEGKSEFLWNINDSVFDSLSLNFNMKNPLSSESLMVTAELTNPMAEPFSTDALKKSFYLNIQTVLNNFGMNRFTSEHSDNNQLTATFIASGTLENPYIGVNIDSLNLMTAGKTISAAGSAYVEEKNLTVDKFKLNYNNIVVDKVSALFDLRTFTGKLKAEMDGVVAKQTVHVPAEFSVSDTVIEEGKIFPTEFAASLCCHDISGTLFKKPFPFELTVLHTADVTTVYTSQEQGIFGSVYKNGDMEFSIAEGKPLMFNFSGNLLGERLSAGVTNLQVDVEKLFSYVDISRIKIFNGVLKGSVNISGMKSDPEFFGALSLSNADFTLPKIQAQHVTIPKAVFVINQNKIELPEIQGMVKKDIPLYASMNVFFDRWSFDRLEARIHNPKNVYMPCDFEIRLARFVGDVNLDLNLVFQDSYLDVTGDIYLKKVTGSVKTRELANTPPKRKWFPRSDLNIFFGQHVTFIFDPLLRAVLVPNTKFGFKYDMSAGDLELDGELAFRSGDISYLSRNFYLKNGIMRFNANDPTFNPLISLQAETREKDEQGNDVRIILTANNQYLLNFNAQFSSIPAKSETEIRALLGQIAVGDSANVSSLLLATGDYAIQSTIGRSIENKLRDFLNFDILSVRTNVLQNALSYGLLSRNESAEKAQTDLKIGNFFDNSTVYLGKYLGSSIYLDTLMHWSYDETRVDDKFSAGGLVFKPEIGLELESPFGNIRWNMAPDINGFRSDRFVSSTSVTLSWKFSF